MIRNYSEVRPDWIARAVGGTDHSNTPAADDGGQHIDGNSNPTLLEDPPVEAKQGEFDTADRARIGELRDEESLGPDDTGVWRTCPDVFAEAMLYHYHDGRQNGVVTGLKTYYK